MSAPPHDDADVVGEKDSPWTVLRSYTFYMVPPLLGLLTGPILTRALSVEDRGVMAAVLQPLVVAEAAVQLGLPMAVSLAVSRGADAAKAVASAWRIGRVVSLVAVGVMCGIAVPYSQQIGMPYWQLCLFWTWPMWSTYLSLRRHANSGAGRFLVVDYERVTMGATRLALFSIVWLLGGNAVLPFLICHVAASIVAGAWIWKVPTTRRGTAATPKEDGIDARFAFMAAPGAIARALNNRLDQALIPVLLSTTALGIYTTAVTVAEIPLVLGTVLGRNMLTRAGQGVSLQQCWPTIAAALALTCVPIPFSIWFGPSVMALIFGEPYRDAGNLLWILLLGSAFGVGSQAIIGFLMGLGKGGTSSLVIGAGAILTVGCYVALWVAGSQSLLIVSWIAVGSQCVLFVAGWVAVHRAERRRAVGHLDPAAE